MLVEYVKVKTTEAMGLDSKELLCKSGNNQFREPQTPGERIANDIHNALLQQDRVSWGDDVELAFIEDIAHELCDQTDDAKLWQELFDRSGAIHDKPQSE